VDLRDALLELADEDAQKKAIEDAQKLFGEQARDEVRDTIAYMVRRHREMFPEMHGRPAG
jgi:hypothetical protein